MGKLEDLILEAEKLLRTFSKAMDGRNAALRGWATAKSQHLPTLPECTERLKKSEREYARIGEELRQMNIKIGLAQKQRVLDGAMRVNKPVAV